MDVHQERIIQAAARLGIATIDVSEAWGVDAVLLRYGDRQELSLGGTIFSGLSFQADLLIANKHATKAILRELEIPVPDSLTLEAPAPAVGEFLANHAPAVFKPLCGTEGQGIEIGLRTVEEVQASLTRHRALGPFLLEEFVEGHDLRIQAIRGKLVAACRRVPATVVGDGRSTVADLIAARNELIRTQNADNHIDVDHQTLAVLREQGMTPESVPARGLSVPVKRVANMSQGATAVDVTDELHSGYADWLERVATRFDIDIFSLDAIASDHRLDPADSARVLELNARPQWLHHTFSERRTHDIAALILRSLFDLEEDSP